MAETSWDLTTRKRVSRKHRIIKCPVCGRFGQVKFYAGKSKTEMFAGCVDHKGHVEMGMFNMVDDSCTLNETQAGQAQKSLEVK